MRIEHDENGWYAEDTGATTQYFPTEAELKTALAEEESLRKLRELSDLAVPGDSPINWEY